MENEKMIINYALRRLKAGDGKLELEFEMMLKLFDKFPSYDWGTIVKAFCEEEETC